MSDSQPPVIMTETEDLDALRRDADRNRWLRGARPAMVANRGAMNHLIKTCNGDGFVPDSN